MTMSERPLGTRPEQDRSDWTEQDLLTNAKALPLLDTAIAEASEQLTRATSVEKPELERRLASMHLARQAMGKQR